MFDIFSDFDFAEFHRKITSAFQFIMLQLEDQTLKKYKTPFWKGLKECSRMHSMDLHNNNDR